MAYAVYPSTLPIPEMPLNGDIKLPLQASSLNEIGAYTTFRAKTRACLIANSVIFLDSSGDFNTIFIPFYRVTLNDGVKKFTATWLTYFGFKGYVGKILNFKANLIGFKPQIQLDFEFTPDVQYRISAPTIPSPWPSKANS